MFLLPKLDQVSLFFPDDVEGTREFLLDRGIPAGSAEALTHFSARLAIDPSFRRDITALVQGVIRREDEAVDYMDLLGILVVAAAGPGPFDGNDEQEESVRELLRFLTQVRRPTAPVAPVSVQSRPVAPVVAPAQPLSAERTSLPVRRRAPVPFSPVEKSEPWRWWGAAAWIAGGMVLSIALGRGWILHERRFATPQTKAALRTAPSSHLPVNEKDGVGNDELAMAPAAPVWTPLAPSASRPSPTVQRHLNALRTRPTQSPIKQHVAPVSRTPSLGAGHAAPPVKLATTVPPAVIAAADSRARPMDAVPENVARSTPPADAPTASTPSVRRRLPKSVVINPGPLRRPEGWATNSNTSAPGVVHPASVGMMASNLISSPAPEYPAAATQARVQGAVTVRAVVDREGKVIEARVVSGPELLRDVSLEAVQHWRYRPYMQGGKPVEVATTAVLDFELP